MAFALYTTLVINAVAQTDSLANLKRIRAAEGRVAEVLGLTVDQSTEAIGLRRGPLESVMKARPSDWFTRNLNLRIGSGDPAAKPGPPGTTEHWPGGGPPMNRSGVRLLSNGLRPHRRALLHVGAWSLAGALPAVASGALVALAADEGFLIGRYDVGMGLLTLLMLTLAVRACATRQLILRTGTVAEALRDTLVEDLAASASPEEAVHGRPRSPMAATWLGSRVESVRSLTAALLRAFGEAGLTITAALAGVFWLSPPLGFLLLFPVAVSLILLWPLTHTLVRLQQRMVMAEEAVADHTLMVFAAQPTAVSSRSRTAAGRSVARVTATQAHAAWAVGRARAMEACVVMLGAHTPLMCLLLSAPWLLGRTGMTAGQLLGSLTYLTLCLGPAIRSLADLILGSGPQLAVAADQLAAVTGPSDRSS
ncbi:hypothetical protein [Streptomyces sp. NPDC060027]|uniref:hypothetical protein n=1 Tax=Streptomyces sp. NPDC060027 TaxID=3347040 RepID=UPI0036776979